ncbi:hypothetical protein GE061_018702 [Apolygus lucorum]|uniref:Uncharacterized protein n=1 Tax=Apolygus lucorum TaxID=248454 RepID=A0A6A4ITM5_APOLU|nr:hypothetical protein GE061_018702 [Apolygus lucorum]
MASTSTPSSSLSSTTAKRGLDSAVTSDDDACDNSVDYFNCSHKEDENTIHFSDEDEEEQFRAVCKRVCEIRKTSSLFDGVPEETVVSFIINQICSSEGFDLNNHENVQYRGCLAELNEKVSKQGQLEQPLTSLDHQELFNKLFGCLQPPLRKRTTSILASSFYPTICNELLSRDKQTFIPRISLKMGAPHRSSNAKAMFIVQLPATFQVVGTVKSVPAEKGADYVVVPFTENSTFQDVISKAIPKKCLEQLHEIYHPSRSNASSKRMRREPTPESTNCNREELENIDFKNMNCSCMIRLTQKVDACKINITADSKKCVIEKIESKGNSKDNRPLIDQRCVVVSFDGGYLKIFSNKDSNDKKKRELALNDPTQPTHTATLTLWANLAIVVGELSQIKKYWKDVGQPDVNNA